jgi:hypothetical protein
MIQLPKDFVEFLQLLNSNEVEYLVVGGYAVGFYFFVLEFFVPFLPLG